MYSRNQHTWVLPVGTQARIFELLSLHKEVNTASLGLISTWPTLSPLWERQAFVSCKDTKQVMFSPLCKVARPLRTKCFLRFYPCSIDQFHTEQHNGICSVFRHLPQAALLLTGWIRSSTRANCLLVSVGICHLPETCFQERRHELGAVQITQYACVKLGRP